MPEPEIEPIAGKGRPTPKRSEARKARRIAGAPKTRKEASAAMRTRNREERQRQRAALVTGDERNLPARDAGPAKRLARDIVDSHFTYGQVFFGMIFLVLALSLVPSALAHLIANVAVLAALVVMILDGRRHARAAKVAVIARYGLQESAGITSYAFLRAMLPRRMRRPPAVVRRGGQIRD
jgi:hypothetical protein